MKKLLAVVAVVSLSVGSVFATQTRIGGLGIASWMIEEDDTLIWMNPARVSDNSRTIWGEMGNALGSGVAPAVDANVAIRNQWGGITTDCPILEGNVLGLFIARPYGGQVANIGANAPGSDVAAIPVALTPLTPTNKFDLIYGMPIGAINLGVALNMAGNSRVTETSFTSAPNRIAGDDIRKTSLVSGDTNLTVGVVMKDIAVIEKLDVALNYGMPSVKNTDTLDIWDGTKFVRFTDDELKSDGASAISVAARAAIPVKNSKLLALVGYVSNNNSSSCNNRVDNNGDGDFLDAGDVNYIQTRKNTLDLITIGASVNTKISDKALLITALTLNQISTVLDAKRQDARTATPGVDQEYNIKTSAMSIPLNIGLEYAIAKPVVGRLGISRDIINTMVAEINDPDYGAHDGTTYPLTDTIVNKFEADRQAAGATTVTVGAGIQVLKDLAVDAVVRQAVLFSGTYIVSGIPETLVSQITATYKF